MKKYSYVAIAERNDNGDFVAAINKYGDAGFKMLPETLNILSILEANFAIVSWKG